MEHVITFLNVRTAYSTIFLLIESKVTFQNVQDVRDDLRNSIAKDAVTIESESLKVPDACKNMVEEPNFPTDQKYPQTSNDLSLDFQKKINLYETAGLPMNLKSEFFLSGACLEQYPDSWSSFL